MITFMKLCDHEPQLVFTTKNANYYAADGDNVGLFEGNLIVNLSGKLGPRTGSNVLQIPRLAKHMLKVPEEITINWKDFGDPPVKATFWSALDSYVGSKKYKEVVFNCEHGHGRTGTGLCSMMIATGIEAAEAIFRIRSEYCKQAVESSRQIFYLLDLDAQLNGRNLPEDEEELQTLIEDLSAVGRSLDRLKRFSQFEDDTLENIKY